MSDFNENDLVKDWVLDLIVYALMGLAGLCCLAFAGACVGAVVWFIKLLIKA